MYAFQPFESHTTNTRNTTPTMPRCEYCSHLFQQFNIPLNGSDRADTTTSTTTIPSFCPHCHKEIPHLETTIRDITRSISQRTRKSQTQHLQLAALEAEVTHLKTTLANTTAAIACEQAEKDELEIALNMIVGHATNRTAPLDELIAVWESEVKCVNEDGQHRAALWMQRYTDALEAKRAR